MKTRMFLNVAAAALSGLAGLSGSLEGAVTVTASRQYVDRATTLSPVTNDGAFVGYALGAQTNKVLVSKEYVDDNASTPSTYSMVSNAAMNALSRKEAEANEFQPDFPNFTQPPLQILSPSIILSSLFIT